MAEMLIWHNGAPTTYPRQMETMIDVSRSQVAHMDPFLVWKGVVRTSLTAGLDKEPMLAWDQFDNMPYQLNFPY